MKRILAARAARVRRRGRALLRHLRAFGLDDRAQELRSQLARSVVRLDALVRVFPQPEVVAEVLRVRVGVLGLNDQIDATLLAAATAGPAVPPNPT